MSELIDTKQIELHFEAANDGGNMAERGAVMAVTGAIKAGLELQLAKEAMGHGNWIAELRKNWNYSQDMAIRYMRIAANSARVPNLKDAKSIREALRMIADDKAESEPNIVPRSERKPADVVVSIPAENREFQDEPDINVPFSPPDDDPTPDPPTIQTTAAGTRRTTAEAREAAQRTMVATEESRAKVVEAEIVIDDPVDPDVWDMMTFGEILAVAVSKLADDHKKKAAKELRKAADKLDPPTKFVKPDLDEVSEYFRELKAVDPESFFDFYESKGWLVGKVSMKDWRASARKWVRENAANGSNGHGSANRRTVKRRPTVEEVFG